jgi:hypothetical protein
MAQSLSLRTLTLALSLNRSIVQRQGHTTVTYEARDYTTSCQRLTLIVHQQAQPFSGTASITVAIPTALCANGRSV